jgi:hypothetical protein
MYDSSVRIAVVRFPFKRDNNAVPGTSGTAGDRPWVLPKKYWCLREYIRRITSMKTSQSSCDKTKVTGIRGNVQRAVRVVGAAGLIVAAAIAPASAAIAPLTAYGVAYGYAAAYWNAVGALEANCPGMVTNVRRVNTFTLWDGETEVDLAATCVF